MINFNWNQACKVALALALTSSLFGTGYAQAAGQKGRGTGKTVLPEVVKAEPGKTQAKQVKEAIARGGAIHATGSLGKAIESISLSKTLNDQFGANRVKEITEKLNENNGTLVREFYDAIPMRPDGQAKAGSALLVRLSFALARISAAVDGKFSEGNGAQILAAYSALKNPDQKTADIETRTKFVERYESLANRIESEAKGGNAREAIVSDITDFLKAKDQKVSDAELRERVKEVLKCLGLNLIS